MSIICKGEGLAIFNSTIGSLGEVFWTASLLSVIQNANSGRVKLLSESCGGSLKWMSLAELNSIQMN